MASVLNKILCIDDDKDILAVVSLCLQTVGGYEVFGCSNGSDAVAMLADIKPDLILLDVMMPGMDGPSVALKLREHPLGSKTPIIFMTARVQEHEVEKYSAYGASAIIAKPFNPMTLAKQIALIWEKQHA